MVVSHLPFSRRSFPLAEAPRLCGVECALRLAAAVAVVLAVTTGVAGPAQAQDDPAILRGFVTNAANGQYLDGANVVLLEDSTVAYATATSDDGFYQLAPVEPGTYTFRVSYIGYGTFTDTLRLRSGVRRVDAELETVKQQLQEVTVEARQEIQEAEAGLQRVQPADVERIPTPGPGSDLAAYLRTLPGVTAIGDRGGRLYVRGGTPSQNLVLVDGTPIYKPFHILGFYSAFPSDLVGSADFYAGGFSAEYMGRASSVLDVNLRSGNSKRFAGQVAASPFLMSGRVEGPLADGVSFIAHARQSLIEETAGPLIGEDTPLKFYDVIGKITGASAQAQCSATALRTYDRGRIEPASDASFRWSNTSLGGHCLAFGSTSAQVVDLSVGGSHFGNTVRTTEGSERSASTWIIRTNLRVGQPVSWGQVEWGIWAQVNQYSVELNEALLSQEADDEFLVTAGGFAQTELVFGSDEQVKLEPSTGLMVSPLSIEPRLRFSWQPGGSETMKLTAAGGVYRQLAEGITDERDAGSLFIAWLPSPIENRLLQSNHALAGWHQQLTAGLTLDVEGYYKQFRDVPVPKWTAVSVFNTRLTLADGNAYGADLQLRYQNDPFDLRASYGLGWVNYWADSDALNAWDKDGRVTYQPPHDRRHQVTVVASARLGEYTADLRWQYGSGRPFTQAYGYDTMPIVRGLEQNPREDIGVPRLLYDEPYNARLPSYHRLDGSVSRTFQISPVLALEAEAGAINAYNRSNLFYVDVFTQERVDQLPVIPYLSLTVEFN